MKMIMEYKISFDCDSFNKETDSFDLGGYEFKVNGLNVPFDFEALSYNVEVKENRLNLTYESGSGTFFNEYDLDECFDETYEELGLSRDVIDAKFLASATNIEEFYVDFISSCNSIDLTEKNFKIEYINFTDYQTGEEFSVNKEVLNKFKLI